jgi:large subunit ribosomal protein L15
MLKLNNIGAPKGANRDKKRRGRGPGSGQGKTGGRGHKGQKARSGGGIPPWFEGGQMPLNRRLPKRGFTNVFKKSFQLVNLDALEARMEAGRVDGESLAAAGLVKYADRPVKLLGRGQVSKKFEIEVAKASKSAIAAVEAAGGTVTVKG